MWAKLQAYGLAIAIGIIAAGAAVVGGYWKGGNDRQDHLQAKAASDDAAAQTRQDEVLNIVAKGIAGMKGKNVTIVQKATETIREVPVYQECKNTPEVKALIEASMLP